MELLRKCDTNHAFCRGMMHQKVLTDMGPLILDFPASKTALNINMNLDSIHRLIEETQIFRMQRSSIQSRCDPSAPVSSPRDTWTPCLPLPGLQPQAPYRFCAHPLHSNEWDVCEELRLRELEEVKARAAQMEKTMRWWSDCTANWREKWSKVRAERNSAREEGRQLRMRLEMTVKELSELRKRQGPSPGKEPRDRKLPPPARDRGDGPEVGSQTCERVGERLLRGQCRAPEAVGSQEDAIIDPLRLNEEMKSNLDSPDLFKKCGSGNCAMKPELRLQAINLPLENDVTDMSTLQVHLDDFQKILWKEREMRAALENQVERLESALSLWKLKYEELKELKPKSVEELERLQVENTLEWDKREVIEAEKQGLQRETRRLKVQVKEMEEILDGKHRSSASTQGPDFNTSQMELQEKSKELLDLQHAYYKLSRQYQAKMAELTHANHLVDQHEAEEKKLRFQVEELKQGLIQKEAELDDSLSQIRKLQRSLDEQKETNGNLEIEIKHLQNRAGSWKWKKTVP
ncbi:coiled-coil domain-containing protein 102B isoform X2 [Lepus europaeus]|uniref:coiled-coil domain-containing protein 102B isoform X2 n=1 Tax=Lepus europaeus TaxID=9983 RepID=UPI002B489F96|nr:coiled-coil domain-containing protein 102B isoform X2 [Lepus europaeus]